MSGVAGILFGIIVGYLIATQQGVNGTAAAPAPVVGTTTTPAPSAPAVTDQDLQPFRDALRDNPRNARAATELGNRLYDAGRWAEAIGYYRQALAVEPKNVGVSTDLATALWYTGDADAALAQFEKSLAIDSTHAQTLFNIGIVKTQGKNDHKGAVAAWEKLLATNPSYPEADRVRRLIDETKAKTGA
ncbi:MAG TPA: tetratricopeptide repeat protein [Vicinamibacterales bacterium]|nr:tetratricopeptide repeat protein [Vicinamibacterales bacterium]